MNFCSTNNFLYSVTEVLCCVFENYEEAKFHAIDKGVGGKVGQKKRKALNFYLIKPLLCHLLDVNQSPQRSWFTLWGTFRFSY